MLDKDTIEQLKLMFVTREECDSTNDAINRKLSNDSTELALIKQQLSSVLWIGKTTLGTVLTAIVGAIIAMVLK